MALPGSGAISFADIATELGRTGTSVSLNQSDVATLAGKATTDSIILPNDFWGKSFGMVQLPTTISIDDVGFSGMSGVCEIRFNSDGILQQYQENGDPQLLDLDPWWSAGSTSGIGSSYDIRASIVSGTVSAGSASTGSWLNLGTSRLWRKSKGTPGVSTVVLTIEIRNASTLSVLDSSTVTLSAEGSF